MKQSLSAKLCQLCQQFSAKIGLNLAQIMAEGYEICFSQALINQMHDTTLEKQQWRCRGLELSLQNTKNTSLIQNPDHIEQMDGS